MIPLKIKGTHLCIIMDPEGGDPETGYVGWSNAQFTAYSIDNKMYPSEVKVTAETYSQDAERTANFELETLTLINAKSKPEFTWTLIKAEYVSRLLTYIGFKYNYKDEFGDIVPREAPALAITFPDFLGLRTIDCYFGQTINGTLVEYDGVLYWQDFRLAFPEK